MIEISHTEALALNLGALANLAANVGEEPPTLAI
jgi:hypothetical protein